MPPNYVVEQVQTCASPKSGISDALDVAVPPNLRAKFDESFTHDFSFHRYELYVQSPAFPSVFFRIRRCTYLLEVIN